MIYQRAQADGASGGPGYAALDLGTNNCRLLVAAPRRSGFKVVDGFSRIVRLGEGLAHTGRLSSAAMERTLGALHVCAQKVGSHRVGTLACVATQACRIAENGAEFLERVRRETGLTFTIITPEQEAALAVLGCAQLIDPGAELALVVDIGGGSTELSWVDADALAASQQGAPALLHWVSLPVGVVSLSEAFPEPAAPDAGWYARMRDACTAALDAQPPPAWLKERFERVGARHLVGTSGTVTSLAGVHLGLRQYRRDRVDGLWLTQAEVADAAGKLRDMTSAARAAHPCIGRDRADLVVAGCAILDAVMRAWPAPRIRVADRGLREGLLILMSRAGDGQGPSGARGPAHG